MFSFNRSLKQIFTSVSIIIVITLGLLNIIPITLEKRVHQQEMVENLNEVLDLQAIFVDQWLKERLLDVRTLATVPAVKSLHIEKMNELLKAFVESNSDFTALVFVNESGRIELDTAATKIPQANLADRVYFLEAKKGNEHITDVIISRNTGKPIVIFSAPVHDDNGQFKGLLFGSAELTTIEKIMTQFEFGNSGETYIVNEDGTLITKPRTTELAIGEVRLPLETLQLALNKKSFNLFYDNYQNHPVIGTYKWVNNQRWLIVGEIHKNEVLPHFYRNAFLMAAISIVVLLIAYFFMSKLYKLIQMPLQYVLKGANLIMNGNYDVNFDDSYIVNSPVELQELCDKFNSMSETIKENIVQLEESEAKFRTLFINAHDAIVITDEKMNIVSWNRGAETIFCYSKEEMVGRSLSTIIPVRYEHWDLRMIKNYFLNANKNKGSKVRQVFGLQKDGTKFPIEISIHSWEFDKRTYLCGIIRDITKRKQQEKTLFEAKERFQSIFDNAGIGIVTVDLCGRLIEINRTFNELLNYKKEELITKKFTEITHPDDIEKDVNSFEKLKKKELNSYQIEKRYFTKDGQIIWARLTVSAVNNDQGKIDYVIAIVEDITEKKNSEEALRSNEEYLNRIVQTVPSGIVIINASGEVSFANQMAEELLQLSSCKNNGEIITPNYHSNIIKDLPFVKVLETGEAINNTEMIVKNQTNGDVMISVNAAPLHKANGSISSVLIAITDITERFKIEKKLQVANSILKELSSIDGLTSVSNRRHFNEMLEKEWKRHERNGKPISIIMFDIDFFKEYNDCYGHQKGDECLKKVSAHAKQQLKRPGDLICRFGGEEFIIILPETDEQGATHIGETIRLNIKSLKIPHRGSNVSEDLTVSIGVATAKEKQYSSSKQLINDADKALYQAKRDGRNCVKLYRKGL